MIHSFDIFDTLVTRLTGSPEGVFSIMQHVLNIDDTFIGFPKILRKDFWHARMNLEQEFRQYSDAEDITITEIYDFISNIFNLDAEEKTKLINLEIETEISVAVGIDENISKLKHLVEKGERVILVSDMYLRKIDVVRILDRIEPFISKHCEIFLSSELKMTKHRGTLFDHILRHFNVEPSEIVHIGDNLHSDVRRARKKKIRAVSYLGAKNNYYENYAVDQKPNSPGIQVMVGMSKLARMKLSTELEKYSCSLAGPWICTFMQWVLESAVKDGSRRLYFLSRDGDLLLQIAGRLKEANPEYSDLELRYLCISRQSSVYPSIEKIDQRAIDHILQKHPYLNYKMIAERTYTSEVTLIDFFKDKYGIRLNGTRINNRKCDKLEKIFKSDPELEKIILDHRDEKRELILRYFEQEGLFDADTIGIVDVGWLCTIQDAVYNIIKNSKYHNKKIVGYYYGITKSSEDTNPHNIKMPFAFHSFTPADIYNKPCFVAWMELFCSSHLDVTQDYLSEGGKIIANQKPGKKNWNEWIHQIRKGIIAYTETFIQFAEHSNLDFSRDQNYYMAAYFNPDKKLAECIGKLHYSGDPLDSDQREFAPRLNLVNIFIPRYSKWFEGSLKRSNIFMKCLVYSAIYAKRSVRCLFFILSSIIKRSI